MKVAVISHAYQQERYLQVLDAMARLRDAEVSLIHPTSYKGGIHYRNFPHMVRDFPVPIRFGSRQGAFVYHGRALARAINACVPEVILHEQEVYSLAAAQVASVAESRSIPLVQFVWENVDRSLVLPRRLLRRYVLSRTSGLIAGSHGAAKVHRGWGFSGVVTVLPQMGVVPSVAPDFGRRRSDRFKVCFVGRLVPCKGVACLLRAMARLHRGSIQTECAIAGTGTERARLEAQGHRLGIDAIVEFRGHLQERDAKELMRSSDVLVLPSRCTKKWNEQFGLVLAEAMAEGTVVVGSRTGAIPEVIGEEDLLFEEDDAEGLARMLKRLAVDEPFFAACQRRLWNRAQNRFCADQIAAERMRFLRRILDESPQRSYASCARSEAAAGAR